MIFSVIIYFYNFDQLCFFFLKFYLTKKKKKILFLVIFFWETFSPFRRVQENDFFFLIDLFKLLFWDNYFKNNNIIFFKINI